MATFGDMVNEVKNLLSSFTGVQEEVVALTTSMDSSTLTINTSDNGRIRRGIIEIDDEMIYVDGWQSNVLTTPFSRGFRGTTAAAHANNALVTLDPMFPRKNIKDAILETQLAVYPDLFRIRTDTSNIYAAGTYVYPLPSDCDRILSVTYDAQYSGNLWPRINRWNFIATANTVDFFTGKAIEIYDLAEPGRTIQVVYAAGFDDFTANTDTLSGHGHQESHRDVLVYGAAWRLIQFVEAGRLEMRAVEQSNRAAYETPGSATNMARQIYALYQQRLAEEKKRMRTLYPTTVRRGV